MVQPHRHQGFNMGVSQLSPLNAGRNMVSGQYQESDSVSHGYDFQRMLQQHLSDGGSTPYRSNLQNIQETENDEDITQNQQSPSQAANRSSSLTNNMCSSFTGISHREGPIDVSHDRGLLHSLYDQAGGYEPLSSDLLTADMCLSTLYLHELYHRQNRRRGVRSQSSQHHVWQLPHQQPPSHEIQSSFTPAALTTNTGTQQSTPPAEKTPLLFPKRT